MSCSQVTPMPPWSWTQSWIISVAWSPRYDLAALTTRRASGPSSCTARAAVGDAVAGLEPHLHVGEAVLERLVRGQGPAEGVAVAQVLERELETRSSTPAVSAHCSTMATGAGARRGGRAADLAHDRAGGDPHLVEVDVGEAPDEVDRLERGRP